MSQLNQVNWSDGRGIEDLVLWGIKPMLHLLELLDEYNDDEDERISFFYYELRGESIWN